jgi:hypothetical protein
MNQRTIGEIHGLDDAPPAKQRPHPKAKAHDPPFVDPPEDEDPIIQSSLGVFHRFTFPDQKLSAVVAKNATLPKLAVRMCNTASGCWIALSSLRISYRVADSIGLTHRVEIVNQSGVPLCFD